MASLVHPRSGTVATAHTPDPSKSLRIAHDSKSSVREKEEKREMRGEGEIGTERGETRDVTGREERREIEMEEREEMQTSKGRNRGS